MYLNTFSQFLHYLRFIGSIGYGRYLILPGPAFSNIHLNTTIIYTDESSASLYYVCCAVILISRNRTAHQGAYL